MIRTAKEEDVPAILDIYAPYVLETSASFEYEPPTLEAMRARFDAITRDYPWLVFADGEDLLGFAYASPMAERAAYRWCADVSIYVRRGCGRGGIGTALYRALEETLYRQNVTRLCAVITDVNMLSVAFHTRCGYAVSGHFEDCGYKAGRWYGIYWMTKALDSPAHPGAFIPAPQVPCGTFPRIRPAVPADADELQTIYDRARRVMRESGNLSQWNGAYPGRADALDDIQKGQLWVLADAMRIHAVFAFIPGEEPTYAAIEGGAWLNGAPYATIHRIASAGTVPHAADICFDWCKERAENLRIDTHEDNAIMRRVLAKNGFVPCGTIYLSDGAPRLAFQYSAGKA